MPSHGALKDRRADIFARLRTLNTTVKAIEADRTLSKAAKNAAVQKHVPELSALMLDVKEVDSQLATYDQATRMMGGGGTPGQVTMLPDAASGKSAPRGQHLTSPLYLSVDELRAFHGAAERKQIWRASIDIKAPQSVGGLPSPGLPAQLVTPPVAMELETTRVAALLPTRAVDQPLVEYMRHDSGTGISTVAEGATKPTVVLASSAETVAIQKLAGIIQVTTELVQDYPSFAQSIPSELTRSLYDTESRFLLDGVTPGDVPSGTTATGGMMGTTGILTYAVPSSDTAAGSPSLRAVNHSFGMLRAGAAFATADSIVLSPATFTSLRGATDSMGRFLLGEPAGDGEVPTLWGARVSITTQIADGEAMIFDSGKFGEVLVRQGVTLELGYNGTDWANNTATWRVEERIALAVIRPAAGLLLTGLATS